MNKKTWNNDCRFCTFFKFDFLLVFFLDNYILTHFFFLFYEMWGFENKWCENPPGICVVLDVIISHMKQWSRRQRCWYTEKMLNKIKTAAIVCKRLMFHKHVIVPKNYHYIALHIDVYVEKMTFKVTNNLGEISHGFANRIYT